MGLWQQALLATVVLTVMECFCGHFFVFVDPNDKVWHYHESWIPTCRGYISVVSSAGWFIMSYLFLRYAVGWIDGLSTALGDK